MSNRATVVGAGVIGASTALALAEQGFCVSLIDKAATLGQGASGANGAQLSYHYTDAMASPEVVRSLPKLILGLDPAFRISPKLDIDYIKWGWQFLANASQSQSDKNTLSILKIALRSKEVIDSWVNQYKFGFQHRSAQKMLLYENSRSLEAAWHRVELKNRHGADQAILSAEQALELEPALEKMNATLAGAVYSRADEVGNVELFTKAAIDQALALGGGELHLDTVLRDLVIENGRCRALNTSSGQIETEHLVICSGFETSKLAKSFGIKVAPIIPVAGYSVTFADTEFTPDVSLTDTANKIVLCHLGDKLRVAGMADVGSTPKMPPQHRIRFLKKVLQQRFPQAGDYQNCLLEWAGIRPMTASSVPIIERSPLPNVYVNSGHGMLGWTLAAGSAAILSEILSESV